MELLLATCTCIIAIIVAIAIAVMFKNHPAKLEEPEMEVGRATGMLALRKRDYGVSDVTTVAQQETVRERTEETKNNKVNIITTDSSIQYSVSIITYCQHSFYLKGT